MTEIYCKCGVQTLEDTTCAECGEPLRVRWIPVGENSKPPLGMNALLYSDKTILFVVIHGYINQENNSDGLSFPTHYFHIPQPQEVE